MLKIYRARVEPGEAAGPPGTVAARDGRLLVSAAGGTLEILELQQEGKKRMTSEEFLRGYQFSSTPLS